MSRENVSIKYTIKTNKNRHKNYWGTIDMLSCHFNDITLHTNVVSLFFRELPIG